MTMNEAYAQLPVSAEWSCSFGYPGDGGFTEFHRTPDGTRYEISNGSYLDGGRNWSCRKVEG